MPHHTLEQLHTGQLAGTTHLKLACGLTALPRAVFSLADTLEVLDLSGNQLTTLPDDLPRLGKLRVVFASNNRFTTLPAVLGRCEQLTMIGFKANQIRHVPDDAFPPRLRWLILTDNQIDQLPASIGQCHQLEKLLLAGNQLRSLPAALAQCQQLALLRVSANRLGPLPDWLLQMPRLAWLACSAQARQPAEACAVCSTAAPEAPGDGIAWTRLHLGARLGEGASGTIDSAELDAGTPAATLVAVKLFKGEMTSDGLPESEMTAALQAGPHPHLITALGRLTGHPEGRQGVVMPRIAPQFEPLAAPPSMASCSRDVYAASATFTTPQIIAIAHGIASAAQHLHARGLMHGDLYAHNILRSGHQALLGDFGAASFIAPHNQPHAQALQRLEVRAFGYLLEELLARGSSTDPTPLALLAALRTACLDNIPVHRPDFAAITQVLASLGSGVCTTQPAAV